MSSVSFSASRRDKIPTSAFKLPPRSAAPFPVRSAARADFFDCSFFNTVLPFSIFVSPSIYFEIEEGILFA